MLQWESVFVAGGKTGINVRMGLSIRKMKWGEEVF